MKNGLDPPFEITASVRHSIMNNGFDASFDKEK
jgi:hypothetical protein